MSPNIVIQVQSWVKTNLKNDIFINDSVEVGLLAGAQNFVALYTLTESSLSDSPGKCKWTLYLVQSSS